MSGDLKGRGEETRRRQTHPEEHHVMMEAETGTVPGKKHGNLPLDSQEGNTPADTLILDFWSPEL